MYVEVEFFFLATQVSFPDQNLSIVVVIFLYQLYRCEIDNSSAGPLAEATHKTSSGCHQYSVVPEEMVR